MLPNKAERYGDGYEGCDGDEPQACSDGASGLSCIGYDYQMACTPKKQHILLGMSDGELEVKACRK